VDKFAAFSERPKAKSVSASRGFAPLSRTLLGLRPLSLIIGAAHLYFGGPPTLYRRHWRYFMLLSVAQSVRFPNLKCFINTQGSYFPTKLLRKPEKHIPDIIDRNLKKD